MLFDILYIILYSIHALCYVPFLYYSIRCIMHYSINYSTRYTVYYSIYYSIRCTKYYTICHSIYYYVRCAMCYTICNFVHYSICCTMHHAPCIWCILHTNYASCSVFLCLYTILVSTSNYPVFFSNVVLSFAFFTASAVTVSVLCCSFIVHVGYKVHVSIPYHPK